MYLCKGEREQFVLCSDFGSWQHTKLQICPCTSFHILVGHITPGVPREQLSWEMGGNPGPCIGKCKRTEDALPARLRFTLPCIPFLVDVKMRKGKTLTSQLIIAGPCASIRDIVPEHPLVMH